MSRERLKRGTLPPAQENIEKLEKFVDEGNYYGAQQMYKSISARYISTQRYSEALDILHSGACIQLKPGQNYDKIPLLDRVRKIYKMFPQIPLPQHLGDDDDVQELAEAIGAAKTRVEGCSSFLKAAIK